MADVKTININSTDYDIKDAKALRNKDTAGTDSFIDTRAGDTTYPTTGTNATNSIIIGDKAIVSTTNSVTKSVALGSYANVKDSYATAIGAGAQATGWASTAIGDASYATQSSSVALGYYAGAAAAASVAVGNNAYVSGGYSVSIGSSAQTSGNYSCSLGFNARTTSNNSLALGSSSSIGNYSQYAVVIGCGASITGTYKNYAMALGGYATVNAGYAVQIGSGTNNHYGSLQFRDWMLVNNEGKMPEERLPDSIKTVSPTFPNLYYIDEEKVSEQSVLYTGETKGIYKNSQFYRGRVRYGYPHFSCGWADTDWLDSSNDVMIDQQKFFTKLAEVTKQRIDDDDVANGLIGGDNAEQSIYLYYDADNDYYFIRFDSDSLEQAFNSTPDDITGLSFDDFADYGIYFKNFHKPSDLEGEYEFCNICYYAPAYIDGYSWNDSPSYINYFKLMSGMNDYDCGFGYVINNIGYWEYEVDGTTYGMPVIPKTYISTRDGDEYDGVTVRWEWNDGSWHQYINGEDIAYDWTTAEMYDTFGIKIEPGEEENVEYVEFYFRGADQRYWEQFNPIDETEFAKQEDLTALETQVQPLLDWKVNTRTGNMYNLNNYTTPGWYYFPNASNVTNKPSTLGIGFMLLVQKNINNIISQHLFACVVNNIIGGTNYGYETSMVYSRVFAFNYWYAWQTYLTNGTMCNIITGYDSTKKQYLVHDANANKLKWEDAQ